MSTGAKSATSRSSARRPGPAPAPPPFISSPTQHTESGTNIWALLKSIPVSSQNDYLAENPADALGIPVGPWVPWRCVLRVRERTGQERESVTASGQRGLGHRAWERGRRLRAYISAETRSYAHAHTLRCIHTHSCGDIAGGGTRAPMAARLS